MLFSDFIPEDLKEYSNVSRFASVLDNLYLFKQEIIADALRSKNPAILMDKKWLLKHLSDYGVTLPIDLPIQVIRQFLLNADVICGTKGSKKGLELYLSVLSFGKVTVDDKDFFSYPKTLLLDSKVQGFITEDSKKDYYFISENSQTQGTKAVISFTVESKYFNGSYPTEATTIQSFMRSSIDQQLGFSPYKEVNFTFKSADAFYFHELLNPYFV